MYIGAIINITPSSLSPSQLIACATGCSDIHLADFDGQRVHSGIINDLNALAESAKKAGFELKIASSFRDFKRQSAIWNAKFLNQRPVLNKQQQIVDLTDLSELDICHAILLYSALPGASRHHFGTDIDIFDQAAITPNYKLQLEPHEYEQGGPFAEMNAWLSDNLARFGFYRPYEKDLGGVAPEPWHISHVAQSHTLSNVVTEDVLYTLISRSELAGKNTILANLPALYARYVINVMPSAIQRLKTPTPT